MEAQVHPLLQAGLHGSKVVLVTMLVVQLVTP
ncbi:MAG: hypothetical protein QOE33_3820 [Acidobacteriota bacterium]|nr:hypothetical protein [Acidobacteriota bacterium]